MRKGSSIELALVPICVTELHAACVICTSWCAITFTDWHAFVVDHAVYEVPERVRNGVLSLLVAQQSVTDNDHRAAISSTDIAIFHIITVADGDGVLDRNDDRVTGLEALHDGVCIRNSSVDNLLPRGDGDRGDRSSVR